MRICSVSLIVCILILHFGKLSAQDDTVTPSFPQGSPILRIFTNLHSGLTDADPSKAFELNRAYVGYKYKLDPNFSTELKLDIGNPADISELDHLRRYAYFKTAALYWKKNKWTVRTGIIDTEHFRRQEKHWKHRYVYQSMQDKHRFGPKADLGVTVMFRAADQIELDASLMNGEGYTNLQQDNSFKSSFGISYYPIPKIMIRIYYDFIDKVEWQSTLSTFALYQHKNITVGAEYNRKGNSDYNKDYNKTGLSGYISYDINEKFEIFGRYDQLSSNQPSGFNEPWNLQEDGSAIIAGIQYQPLKYVKIALNYQDWVPYASNLGNMSYIYLNLEVML
ncbi:porin [Bacteroidota bacterium]